MSEMQDSVLERRKEAIEFAKAQAIAGLIVLAVVLGYLMIVYNI